MPRQLNCSHVWLVVSGAPTTYWTHNFKGWIDNTEEQWPYRVKFYKTNYYGESNNNGLPTSIMDIADEGSQQPTDDNLYDLNGRIVRRGTTSLEGLPRGIYIVNGKKALIK